MATKLVFYDIAMRPPVEKNNSPVNTWKTRLALNFRSLPYSTNWVQLPDISSVRTGLNIPACRKFTDGTDFYTLPILVDPTTSRKLGDSFDIAVYLQKQYPAGNDLFPPQPLDYVFSTDVAILIPLSECDEGEYPEYARFNVNVDSAFTSHVILMAQGVPFDPATAEEMKAEFVRRAGVSCWEDFVLTGEQREKLIRSFRDMLGELAKLFGRDGPFLLGDRASYADLIVGAWLRMASMTLPREEWELVRGWHGGVFGRLHDALEIQAATGCVGAALSIGIGAVISAHGGTGTSDALIPYRISVDNVSYAHTTHEGVTHNFINTSVLYHDWHHVHAIDQPMNLTVSMLPDGRVHARTVGFSAMDCGDNCPDKNATNQLAARSGSVPSHVQEIVFAWSARKGWSSKTETRLKGAVFGAAYYVTHEPSGAFQFCSSAYLTDGTIAHVGFNFYGDKYTPNIPPAC
ncbi:hypothetical protein PEX1_005840 [Penicillium expansum]|uniref:GST N-terminal domain-containing protein n=1 Tax=Penicillium expansum TaxID=27334 RepID=A0A0A2JIX8_PENEN|nr:hypothetical protein PEX2_108910 [Penicillium expansum]KGO52240.1 hypothetical protein PEX2_108910 [Penicillium expansum]KGO69142.1 hypothetical protein PEX1_005840 [Penicillium expansum]